MQRFASVSFVELMVAILRFFWLGEIGANRPELFPLFFQTDFGPPILKFLRRREGECYGEWMKGADYIARTVILWFISVLPLLLTTKQVQAVLDVRRDDGKASGTPADLIKERFTVAVTAFSISILLFCSQFLNIVSPRRFEGEFPSHDVDRIPIERKIMLIASLHSALHSPVYH
jgi:hypothetical protein